MHDAQVRGTSKRHMQEATDSNRYKQHEQTNLTRSWTIKRTKWGRQTHRMNDPHTNLEHQMPKTRTPDECRRSNGRPSHEFGPRSAQNSNARRISQMEWTTLTRIWNIKRPKLERQTDFTDQTEDPHTNLEHETSKTRTKDTFGGSNGRTSHGF